MLIVTFEAGKSVILVVVWCTSLAGNRTFQDVAIRDWAEADSVHIIVRLAGRTKCLRNWIITVFDSSFSAGGSIFG